PFAERILLQEPMEVEAAAEEFVSEEVESVDAAVKGALDIIAEKISAESKYRSYIVKVVRDTADIVTAKKKNAADRAGSFEMYYSYQEPIRKIVPHRVLAINRGEKLGILSVKMEYDKERLKRYISKQEIEEKSETGRYMETAVEDAL